MLSSVLVVPQESGAMIHVVTPDVRLVLETAMLKMLDTGFYSIRRQNPVLKMAVSFLSDDQNDMCASMLTDYSIYYD